MSDHKKYLGKKRQKIFSIEKICPKGIPKNLSKQKKILYQSLSYLTQNKMNLLCHLNLIQI
jgi:hypothetical protein